MNLRHINEEVGVIKAHLEQDDPNPLFIVRHAETLLLMAHEFAGQASGEAAVHLGRHDSAAAQPQGQA